MTGKSDASSSRNQSFVPCDTDIVVSESRFLPTKMFFSVVLISMTMLFLTVYGYETVKDAGGAFPEFSA